PPVPAPWVSWRLYEAVVPSTCTPLGHDTLEVSDRGSDEIDRWVELGSSPAIALILGIGFRTGGAHAQPVRIGGSLPVLWVGLPSNHALVSTVPCGEDLRHGPSCVRVVRWASLVIRGPQVSLSQRDGSG